MTSEPPDLDHFDLDDAWRLGAALAERCRGEIVGAMVPNLAEGHRRLEGHGTVWRPPSFRGSVSAAGWPRAAMVQRFVRALTVLEQTVDDA